MKNPGSISVDYDDVVDDEGRPVKPAQGAAPIEYDPSDVVDDLGQPIKSSAIIAQSQAPRPAAAPGPGADLTRLKTDLEAEKANSPRSVLGWLGNIPASGLGLLKGGAEMVLNPVDTLSAVKDVALGGVQKAATKMGADPERNAEYNREPTFDAFLKQMKERYGGLDEIGNTIYTDPAGAALDLSGILSGGASAVASRMPRTAEFLASAARATNPIAAMGRATRATGRGTAHLVEGYLGKSTGVGSEVIRTAARGSDAFKAGMRGAITHEDVLDNVHGAVRDLVERRRANYRAQLAEIPQEVQLDLTPVRDEMTAALGRFNVRVVASKKGKPPSLDFSRSALRHSPQEMGKVQAAFDDLQQWGKRPDDTTPLGVDLLKQGLNEMVTANPGRGDAIVKAVHDSARSLLEREVPGYAEMTADYANASKFLDEVSAELSVGRSAKPGAGIRKLATALNQRADYRKHLIEALDISFGSDVKGAIAGLEMQPIAPRGLVGPMALGAGGTGLFMKLGEYMGDPSKLMLALSGAATFSPRLVGETLAAIATVRRSAAMSATAATAGKVRKIVFNPATYRFVEEGTDAAAERKQQLDEMGKYLTGQTKPDEDSQGIPPPPPIDGSGSGRKDRLDYGGFASYDEFEYGVTRETKRIRQILGELEEYGRVGYSSTSEYFEKALTREEELKQLAARVRAKGAPHENNKLYARTPFADLFPAMFTHVRKIFGASTTENIGAMADYGAPLNEGDGPVTGNNNIRTADRNSNNPFVVLHESGHGIWRRELAESERGEFEELHNGYIERWEENPSLPIPAAMTIYKDDPGHAYASLVATYILDPRAFQAAHPDVYGFINRTFGGVEYKNGKITRPSLSPPPRID